MCHVIDRLQVNSALLHARRNIVSEDIRQLELHPCEKASKLNTTLKIQVNRNRVVIDNRVLLIEFSGLGRVSLFPGIFGTESRTVPHV